MQACECNGKNILVKRSILVLFVTFNLSTKKIIFNIARLKKFILYIISQLTTAIQLVFQQSSIWIKLHSSDDENRVNSDTYPCDKHFTDDILTDKIY